MVCLKVLFECKTWTSFAHVEDKFLLQQIVNKIFLNRLSKPPFAPLQHVRLISINTKSVRFDPLFYNFHHIYSNKQELHKNYNVMETSVKQESLCME